MGLNLKQRWVRLFFGAYLLLVQIILPLLSPLRITGEIEPGEIRNLLLPPLFLLLVLAFGVGRILKVRTLLQMGLGIAFLSAAVIGIPSLLDPDTQRAYVSHLFQVSSAFVMLSIGWGAIDWFGFQFWRRFVILSLIATLISTAITLTALGRGDVGRLYTPAYALLFVASFCAVYSKKMSVLTIIGLFVSNKRGPIVSVLLIFLQHLFSTLKRGRRAQGGQFVKNVFRILISTGFVIVSMMLLVSWASEPENKESAIGRAVNITSGRLMDIVDASASDRSLDELSSGRLEEINQTLATLSATDFLFGSGAGWNIVISGGKTVQNIHFSPLSITAVFGAPFAIFMYCCLAILVIRAVRRKESPEDLSVTERMAPLYLSGALLHSFFAYSLFIDWLVFFFAGVLLKSLSAKRRRARNPLGAAA